MKALITWIKGFNLTADGERYAVEWAQGAFGFLSANEIKSALQEMINFNDIR